MNFAGLVAIVGKLPCFDLALLMQSSSEKREVLRVQLARWMKAGRLIGLRRGVYTLGADDRRTPPVPAVLANLMYRPSYISGLWALGHYDMIPEHVVWYTSVTPRMPRHFENAEGVFDYRHVKQDLFFGYCEEPVAGGQAMLVAVPEKALLDYWHLSPGEWTAPRLEEMRYQNCGRVDERRLREFARRFRSPRLERAVVRWLDLARSEAEGTVVL
jgi:predicted transcriptional regulator of viral defense system